MGAGRGRDATWIGVGALLAVAVMVVVRTAGIPPTGGPGLALSMAGGAAVFLLVFPLLRGPGGLRGPALLRTVVLLLAGATLWDGVAIAAAPAWYGGEASSLTAAAAAILFAVGVLLVAAVGLADRDAAAAGSTLPAAPARRT